MKKAITFCLAFVLVFISLSASSCQKIYKIEELRPALNELIPASLELNEIYFGAGLPISEDRELTEQFFANFDSDIAKINYAPVDRNCGYTTEEDIRTATLAVFTEDYSNYLFERAFAGIATVNNEGTDTENTSTAIYAMYIEQYGILTVRLNIADDAVTVNRTYDIDSAKVTNSRPNYVIVTIPSYIDGNYDSDIKLKLVSTAAGWRLDSPTY